MPWTVHRHIPLYKYVRDAVSGLPREIRKNFKIRSQKRLAVNGIMKMVVSCCFLCAGNSPELP